MSRWIVVCFLLSSSIAGTASGKDHSEAISSSHDVVGVQYQDVDSREFLKEVLRALNLQFSEKVEARGVTVYWSLVSKKQEREITNRVSQYMFVKKVCPQLPLPKPSEPAKDKLSCPE